MSKIYFVSDGLSLAGNLFLPSISLSPGLLILHGAGHSHKERFGQLQVALLEKGIASLAFDFRGVGESEGTFSEGSLSNRLKDASAALEELKKHVDKKKIAIFGSSMGGYLAPLLAYKENAQAIILSAAAAYSPEAEDKMLNEEFTKVIRKPFSWKNSKSFSSLEKFLGKILTIYGQYDTVIPDDIKYRYKEITLRNSGMFSIIPGGTHNIIVGNTPEEKRATEQWLAEISDFLTGVFSKPSRENTSIKRY